jgi:hypothetical protein
LIAKRRDRAFSYSVFESAESNWIVLDFVRVFGFFYRGRTKL